MGLGALVTVLWIARDAPRSCAAVQPALDAQARVVEVDDATLAEAIVDARDRGAVVVIGAADRHARILSLGADEVTDWSVPLPELRAALGRARARSHWRITSRDIQSPELDGLALMGAAIGHEIRNSLASAIINCSTIESLVRDKTSPDLHGSISDLNDALKDVSDVVTQMIALTTPEPGFCDMSNALVELTTYIHRQIETVADFQADIPNVACAVGLSRARALEVVASLLNNAMRAVESVTSRTTHISLRLTQHEEMVVVEVTDNGVGMTPDVRRQALNPFFTTRRPGALGMGLSFAAMTVRRAGGEVLIDSEPDVGTNVRLFLPRMSVSAPASRPNN